PMQWRVLLDPLGVGHKSDNTALDWTNAEMINQYVFSYGSDAIANRVLMILITAAFLAILCFLFKREKRAEDIGVQSHTTILKLSGESESVYGGEVDFRPRQDVQAEMTFTQGKTLLPKAEAASEGFRTHLKQLIAALGVEFRLLRAE